MENRPRGREKNVSGQGKDIYKRGEGLGTGPVGSADGHQGRPGQQAQPTGGQTGQTGRTGSSFTRAAGRSSPLLILIVIAVLIFGGKNLLGGGGSTTTTLPAATVQPAATLPPAAIPTPKPAGTGAAAGSTASQPVDLASLLGGLSASNTTSGWTQTANTGTLNTAAASGSYTKRTKILGSGKDTVTIMVYMCGTDLESGSGMATSDLQEMAAAKLGANVNLLVYTGGCRQWRNNVVSSNVNQIYKVESGGLRCMEKDMGAAPMTKAETLSTFIKWCTKNYPANRNMLIFWDHGGGSLSGYGYDEKFKSSGSMPLKGINDALKDGGTTFDIIGFDTCLMATTENALMLSAYGDYMVA